MQRRYLKKCVWAALFACAALISACGTPQDQQLPTMMVIDLPPTDVVGVGENAGSGVQPLLFWTPVEAALDQPGEIDTYQFEAVQGDDITLRVIGEGTATRLTLIAPDTSVIGEGDTVQAIIPLDGRYTVNVTSSDPGRYELGLRYTNQENPLAAATPLPQVVGVPTPLPAYVSLGDFISAIDDEETIGNQFEPTEGELESHIYTLDGKSGEFITLELNRVSGEVDPLLTLFDASGNPLALDQGSGENGNALLRNVRLPSDGIYSVQAAGDAPGGYSLRLLKQDAPSPVTPTVIITPTQRPVTPVLTPTVAAAESGERMRPYTPVLDELADPDDFARHTFYAEAGEIITLGVRPLVDSALIPRVELIDPNGIPVAVITGNNSPTNRDAILSAYVAEETGPFTAFITANGQSFGGYIVGYGKGSTWEDVMRGEALHDRSNESRIETLGVRDLWYVPYVEGDLITASVMPLDGNLDPVLELVALDGTLIGIDRNSDGPRMPRINGVRAPVTGMYIYRVWAAQPQTRGAYALVWRYIDVAPTPTPPLGTLPLLTLDDSVADQQYRFYPFQGQTGQRVRVRVIADDAAPFDPVAVLLDPQASIVAEGDDSEDGGLNPIFEAELPADGTYTVRVNGYQTGGDFTLIVEALY